MPTNTLQLKKLISIKEAVALTGLSHVTLYNEINAGRLKSLKVGRRRLVRPAALCGRIEQREKEAN